MIRANDRMEDTFQTKESTGGAPLTVAAVTNLIMQR